MITTARPEILNNYRSLGYDAGGAIKLTPNSKTGTRAKAYLKTIYDNTIQRTAGGKTTNALVEFVQDVGGVPADIIKEVFPFTPPGIVIGIYNEGKKTKTQIETRMQNDPVFKEQVNNVVDKVISTGGDIVDTITGPITGVSSLLKYLPHIAIGTLIVATIFAFKNPGSVSTPRKVSVY